jgi:hypothetical protein
MYITCSELVVFMYETGKSMNNLLSICGLVDPRIRASDKDLPVMKSCFWSGPKLFGRVKSYLDIGSKLT